MGRSLGSLSDYVISPPLLPREAKVCTCCRSPHGDSAFCFVPSSSFPSAFSILTDMSQVLFSYCPQALYGGGCTDSGCTLTHDAKYCQICAVICEPAAAYESHCATNAHLKLRNRPRWLHCPICNVSLPTPESWTAHTNGRPHQRRASQQGLNADLVKPVDPPHDSPQLRYCELCSLRLAPDAWVAHMGGKSHRRREQHALFSASIRGGTQEQEGVSVSHEDGLDFGIVSPTAAKDGVEAKIVIDSRSFSPIFEASTTMFSGVTDKVKGKDIKSP